MRPNTYPDGFPLNPVEAIDFSYFLSDSEKLEWKDWLQTATADQQQELVDTLHAMWQENQKEVIPAGFNNPTSQPLLAVPNLDPSPSTSQTNLSFGQNQTEVSSPSSTQTFDDLLPPFPPLPPLPPEFETKKDSSKKETLITQDLTSTISDSKKPNFDEDDEIGENLLSFGQQKYTPNPILEDKTPPPSEFTFTNAANNSSSPQSNPTPAEDKAANKQSEIEASEPKTTKISSNSNKSFFNVSKVREATTRAALEDIYHQYLDSREKSFSSQREYQENHGMFLDKIMQVVINFEQVADYFESMTQKLLEMNDKLVDQAREMRELRSVVTTKQTDLQDQIDELRRDVDRLFRDVKDTRGESRRRYDELSEQLTAFGADSYRQDGMLQRIDLLMAKVHKLEQASKEMGGLSNASIADRMHLAKNTSQSSPKDDNKSDDQIPTIDLRSVI